MESANQIFLIKFCKSQDKTKQAGSELCQAQEMLGLATPALASKKLWSSLLLRHWGLFHFPQIWVVFYLQVKRLCDRLWGRRHLLHSTPSGNAGMTQMKNVCSRTAFIFVNFIWINVTENGTVRCSSFMRLILCKYYSQTCIIYS